MKHTFHRFLFILSLLSAGLFIKPAQAQQQSNVIVQPDCITTFTFVATGSQQINNLGAACINWTVSYSSTGFSALSLVIEDAPDSTGAPGSWVTFAGTVKTGINPNTATTSASTVFVGYFPWMRARLASITGTGKVTGTLYGWKNSSGAIAGSGGGGGGTPGGINGDIQFNNSGAFGGETLVPIVHGGTGTATPALVAGTNITITGSWPNNTINASGGGGGGGGTGGFTAYSGPSETLPAAGTTFFPPGGGGPPSTTEADVQGASPAATISNLYVQLSSPIGI